MHNILSTIVLFFKSEFFKIYCKFVGRKFMIINFFEGLLLHSAINVRLHIFRYIVK